LRGKEIYFGTASTHYEAEKYESGTEQERENKLVGWHYHVPILQVQEKGIAGGGSR
jgi:hypothetical protein